MRSIPAAFTWEMVRHGWTHFAVMTLAMIALPGLVFGALTLQNALDPQDPSSIVLHFTMLVCQLFCFGAVIIPSLQGLSRLYVFPITTTTIILGRILPAMFVVGTMYFVTAAVVNSLFPVNWPLWGPMLFHAVAVACSIATIWFSGSSVPLQVVGVTAVSVPLFSWLKSRYGGVFRQPDHLWSELTSGETLALLATLAGALCVAQWGAGRDRSGETLLWPRWRAFLKWLDDFAVQSSRRFLSPIRAQFWFEWRQKGFLMPVIAVVALMVIFGFWLTFSRSFEDLIGGLTFFPAILSICVVVVGMACGQCSPLQGRAEMGNYLATRPVTDAGIASAIFKSYASSALVAWGIWAVLFTLVGIGRQLFGSGAPVAEGPGRIVILSVLSLPGLWLIGAITCCIIMSGRPHFWASLFLAGFSLMIGVIILHNWVIPLSWRHPLELTVMLSISAAVILGTVVAFVAALRWDKIPSTTGFAALLVWFAILVIYFVPTYVFWLNPKPDADPGSLTPLGLLYLASLSPLMVLPFAAGPLAVAWNRHR